MCAERVSLPPILSLGRDEPLPKDAELQSLVRGVQWYRSSRQLPDAARALSLGKLACAGSADHSAGCSEFAPWAISRNEDRKSGDLGVVVARFSLQKHNIDWYIPLREKYTFRARK